STGRLADAAESVAEALYRLGAREGMVSLPGYTHMQQAMPSTVALWAGGFAAEIRDDAQGLLATLRRIDKNPLGSAAGYGTPGLPVDRDSTRRHLKFAVTHEPVTAVQLSRGKAEAQLAFEITLLTQDIARLACDLLLFYTQEFAYVSLPEGFTTGSSIMPQKRNPDVFELMRGRASLAQSALGEILGITQKLGSGYHRDLQLIKQPLFRSIDACEQTLDILPMALDGVHFNASSIRLDPGIHAAQAANELVMR
ncbi:MAG: argininosuccinate lyase, partial [Proteobacteria bacterium]|nr:argininosuccinate lyase [Pseudomonadota bacterium]